MYLPEFAPVMTTTLFSKVTLVLKVGPCIQIFIITINKANPTIATDNIKPE